MGEKLMGKSRHSPIDFSQCQHKCVSVINNFFSLADLEFYTKPQGVETAPKLDPSLAPAVHSLLTTTNLHPVKLLQTLQSQPSLVEHQRQVERLLGTLCERTMKEGRESFSLKMHYLAFLLQLSRKSERGTRGLIKMLLTFREDGVAVEQDKFLRQCLREFPHVHSLLLKQMVASLAGQPPGSSPSALSMFQQAIGGNKGVQEGESCSTCGDDGGTLKKCSRCKQVWYCGVDCQKLAWTVGNHKQLCKRWAEERRSEETKATKVTEEEEEEKVEAVVGPTKGGGEEEVRTMKSRAGEEGQLASTKEIGEEGGQESLGKEATIGHDDEVALNKPQTEATNS